MTRSLGESLVPLRLRCRFPYDGSVPWLPPKPFDHRAGAYRAACDEPLPRSWQLGRNLVACIFTQLICSQLAEPRMEMPRRLNDSLTARQATAKRAIRVTVAQFSDVNMQNLSAVLCFVSDSVEQSRTGSGSKIPPAEQESRTGLQFLRFDEVDFRRRVSSRSLDE